MNIEEIWEKVKIWTRTKLDQDQNEKILENAIKKTEPTEAEKRVTLLLLNIKSKALSVKTMKIENEFYLPPIYKIHLSSSDYSSLLQSEREFIERKLREIILNHAKEMAGGAKLTTEKVNVLILENNTLEDGEVDVKTSDSLEEKPKTDSPENSDKTIEFDHSGTREVDVMDFEPLYWLEVWENGNKIEEFPILKKHITIGRETKDKAANIRLKTDNKAISSLHAMIKFVSKSDITIEAIHKNITKVGKTVISNGKPDLPAEAKLGENDEIQIFDFKLKFRFE
jgi:hypothetical protein